LKKLIALLFLFIAACSSIQIGNSNYKARTFDADYSIAFTAIEDFCKDSNLKILSADKELGLIKTDYVEFVSTGSSSKGNLRSKINFNLSKTDENKTKVTITLIVERQNNNLWMETTMNQDWTMQTYRNLWNVIGSKLK
jgi:hypothetical protein